MGKLLVEITRIVRPLDCSETGKGHGVALIAASGVNMGTAYSTQ